ncbi:MAG: hypothetical protein JNJ75_09015 [Cyclobacteriaceae bacterium]|nr:hypothetical protein [Cyclobacteriaceae bacterium]
MKNRRVIILLVLVVGIWATIGYKIVSGLSDDHESIQKRPVVSSGKTASDTFLLSLDYADPFFKRKEAIRQNKTKIVQHVQVPNTPAVTVDWNVVKFSGTLYNASKNVPTAIVSINGFEYFVRESESVQGFKISEIVRDSIRVSYQNQSTYIKRVNLN